MAQLVLMRIAKWASSMDEFDSIRVGGILHNWMASPLGGCLKAPKLVVWAPPRVGEFKFNVDREARASQG